MDDTLHGEGEDALAPVDAAPRPDGPLRLDFAAVSDVGRHRKENQDSGYASSHLLVVADGVGGAAYGDVASATAVHLLRRLDAQAHPQDEMLGALAGAIHRVHDKLAEMVEHDGELEGTSTTVTAAIFDGQRLGFAHVGDSRAYLLRGGRVQQVTHDHTFVQTLIDEGRITEDEARVHPHKNIILRAVDGVRDTEPDLFQVELEAGDRVMLCSDGCSGVLDDDAIAALLGEGPVDGAAQALVDAALDNGTTDNVTVVVAEVREDGAETGAAAGGAAASTGSPRGDGTGALARPLIVGAAAAHPRRGGMLSRALFRRQHDTGELEPVPDETLDPEELRYRPRAPRRHAGLRRLLAILIPLFLVVGALWGGYAWSQQQYYVATDGDFVAIYKGVQMDVPGVSLSSVYETDTLKVGDLPEYWKSKVSEGMVANSYDDARRIVRNLEDQVVCPPEEKSAAGQTDGQTAGQTDGQTDGATAGTDEGGTASGSGTRNQQDQNTRDQSTQAQNGTGSNADDSSGGQAGTSTACEPTP